jgi:NodT family efflux transporter outer membrane factor (OMF) lipoprotein
MAVAGAIAGCTVGPSYGPPGAPTPPSGTFAEQAPATASSEAPPANWLRLYDAPAIDQLVARALTHNKNLLAAAANLAQARAALAEARAGRYPATTLSAGAQYGVTPSAQFANALEGLGPASPGGIFSAGLDVSYELDLFGRIHRAVQAAAADYQARQGAEDVTRITVAAETTRAFVNACAYAQELAVARRSLATVSQTYEVTARQAGAGGASDFDVARARELMEQTRASVPGFEGQRRTALFQLAVLTGAPPEEISAAANACTAPPKLATVLPVGDVQGLFKRRPDVRQAERQLAGDVARIGVATAKLYPTITIGLSGATSAPSLPGLGSAANVSYALGPLLSWTFPNTLVAQAQIREARATASASLANFQAAVLQALQDTEDALAAYGAELDRNASLTRARDASQIAFGLAKSRYQLGSVSYLDLLTAETDLVTAASTLAASDQALASDQVTVFKALGGGWEQAPAVIPPPIVDARTGKAPPVR